jgi:NitT/TauT family transport system permease protein
VTLVDEARITRGLPPIDDASATRPPGGRARAVWLASRSVVQPLVATVVVLAVWQAIVRVRDVSPFIVPAPTEVLAAFTEKPQVLFENLWTTVQEAVLGLVAAFLVGTLVGAVIAYSGVARRVIYPYLVVLHITPIVAIAPLLAIWFGLGMGTKVIVTFLIAFFPLTVGAASGLRSADGEMITLMRSLNASERQVLWRVRFPAAAVPMMAGLRIAAPATVVGAVIAEFVSPDKGLGYLILQAKNSLATADLFLSIAACAALGLVFFGIATIAERRLLHWHPSMREAS